MALISFLFVGIILTMHLMGLAWTHIVIVTCFGASIFFGALVIADNDDEKVTGDE